MFHPLSLLFLLSLSLAVFQPSTSLTCYSTVCTDPDEHGLCEQTCGRPDEACHSTFFLTLNHTVQAGMFQCLRVSSEECLSTTCQLETPTPSFGFCCCRSDRCNIIPGLFGDTTPAPPIILPTPSITPPTPPGDQLVCEYNNCTSSFDVNDCYHGYQICPEGPVSGGSDNKNHFCSVRAVRAQNGLFELHSKGCLSTSDSTVLQLGRDRTSCVLDTASSSADISCYCDGLLCNNESNVVYSDPARFVGTDPDARCNQLNCSHSCVISGGSPRCLCPVGMALDVDLLTCTDINECLDVHHNVCSHLCINMNGSFRCDCPADSGLRLAANGYTCEPIPGLFCLKHTANCTSPGGCDNIDFCDRSLEGLGSPGSDVCVTVGAFNSNQEFVIHIQQCFVLDPSHICDEGNECELKARDTDSSVFTCCCRENLCNGRLVYPDLNATSAPPPLTTSPPAGTPGSVEPTSPGGTAGTADMRQPQELTVPISLIVASVVLIVVILVAIVVVVVVCQRHQSGSKRDGDDASDEGDNYSMTSNVQLLPRATNFENPPIGSGRFSTVYKQPVNGIDRAVKVFQRKDHHSYEREVAIYKLPNFKHANVLLFINTVVYPEENQIIFEYHINGSLYDLLNKQSISLKQFCDLAVSASRGLAHLHTEIIKDGMLFKACVAHRDLKSKNILIKSDGTACISDFGLAIKWPIEIPNEAQGQVGTARYMAPEVLEGSINFDREAYFRIDVYAFALILWELTSRTKARNGPVVEYKPPFDDMVPPNPSIEDMRKVVVDRNLRPIIPKVFTNHSDMDDIVNTIQESWDKDGDARLSAQCVCERLSSFVNKFESLSKDSGFAPHHPSNFRFESLEPNIYSSQYDSSLTSGGSPTNTKTALSEASNTLTGGATPTISYPNTALPLDSAQQDMMSSSRDNDRRSVPTATQNTGVGGVNGVGPRPPGGGNPMVNYPRPSHNVAPPLHQAPGGYQYRFVQAPSFPCHPLPPQPMNHRGNHTPPTSVSRQSSNPPTHSSLSQAKRNGTTPTSAHLTNGNARNSREIQAPPIHPAPQSMPPPPSNYQMESTV